MRSFAVFLAIIMTLVLFATISSWTPATATAEEASDMAIIARTEQTTDETQLQGIEVENITADENTAGISGHYIYRHGEQSATMTASLTDFKGPNLDLSSGEEHATATPTYHLLC